MGLTFQSTQNSAMTDLFRIDKKRNQFVIALAGNPNTGKSTVFNVLTGLHQHTGNWPGKTVVNARGEYTYNDMENILVDLPGTYSLFSTSAEEEVARDFICFGNVDAVIVVSDATCLERNLNLVFQVMELTDNVILCINLIDEAQKKNITIDAAGIEKELGIPVVLCAARKGIGIEQLKDTVCKVAKKEIIPSPKLVVYKNYIEEKIRLIQPLIEEKIQGVNARWFALRVIDGDEKLKESIFELLGDRSMEDLSYDVQTTELENTANLVREDVMEQLYKKVEQITNQYVTKDDLKINRDRILDRYITSRIFGIPLMLLVLALVLWVTIIGANVPSNVLSGFFTILEERLTNFFNIVHAPAWLSGILILGLFRTMSWVIAVMLPPMAIFFPLFTILEDLGYLPRVAFNMDHLFKKACAHGKQCLTMCMVYLGMLRIQLMSTILIEFSIDNSLS